MEKIRAHIFVSGRVQGVFFRENTKKKAEQSGLKGWVQNLPDGRVEAVFEGEKDNVEKIIKWAKGGPILAKVEKVDIGWGEYRAEFENFGIKYII